MTEPLTTVSGGYYTGMTLQQAKDKKTFQTIDLNGNNKLEEDEIITQRLSETKAMEEKAQGYMATGGALAAGAGLLAPETGGLSGLFLIPAAVSAGVGLTFEVKLLKEEKITNQAIDNYNKSHPNSVFKK